MAVSVVGYICWEVWVYYSGKKFLGTLILSLPYLLLSTILTVLFLHLDRLCCCCSCTAGGVTSVDDPTTDNRFIMIDGELVEEQKLENIQTVQDITEELISEVVV